MYGLYQLQRRSHYQDDDSSYYPDEHFENLIDTASTIEEIRIKANEYFSKQTTRYNYNQNGYLFEKDAVKTNTIYTDGGGCMAHTHYQIKKLPSLNGN